MVERHRAVFIVNGDEALVETAFLDGDLGAALAFEAERIDSFAADAFHGGNSVTADALVRLRVDLLQRLVARTHAHRLDTGGIFFGANGLGGNRNSNVGDGYYRLETDLDGNGSFETAKTFYRLLGDTNGDRTVNDADVANIDAAILSWVYVGDCDLNGDGVVNATDRLFASRYRGRSIAAWLWLDR